MSDGYDERDDYDGYNGHDSYSERDELLDYGRRDARGRRDKRETRETREKRETRDRRDERDERGAAASDADTDAAWLGDLLSAAAAEYEPDGERLRALVAARIAASETEEAAPASAARRRGLGRDRALRGPFPRRLTVLGRVGLAGIPAGVALATVGAAAAIAVGATATIVSTNHGQAPAKVTVLTPTDGGSGTAGPSPRPSTQAGTHPVGSAGTTRPTSPSSPASAGGSTSPVNTHSAAAPGGGANSLYDVSTLTQTSNPTWTELDFFVTAKQPLTSLKVTIKVADCPGLASPNVYDSGPGNLFSRSQTSNPDGSVTFTLVLDPGQTFTSATGRVEFAAQFNHAATGWNGAADTYVATARTATSTADTVVQGTY